MDGVHPELTEGGKGGGGGVSLLFGGAGPTLYVRQCRAGLRALDEGGERTGGGALSERCMGKRKGKKNKKCRRDGKGTETTVTACQSAWRQKEEEEEEEKEDPTQRRGKKTYERPRRRRRRRRNVERVSILFPQSFLLSLRPLPPPAPCIYRSCCAVLYVRCAAYDGGEDDDAILAPSDM